MNFLEQAALAADEQFQFKVRQAAVTRALQVADMTPTDSIAGYDAHVKRVALAKEVLLGPERWMAPFAVAVASNVSIGPESSDSDIQYSINTYWDGFAGVVKKPA